MTESSFDVLAIGEVMGMLDPDTSGPLEDADSFRLRVAGAEGNVVITLAHLGHSTALISAVGDDPVGRLVTRTLAQQGVNVDHVHVDPDAPTGVFFKERFNDGERRVYYYRHGSAASRLSPRDLDLKRIGCPRLLTVSGVTLGLGDGAGISAVARKAMSWAARDGCTVVFDPNLRPSLWDGVRAAEEFAGIVPDINVLLAGRDELAVLMPSQEPTDAARSLCRSGISTVILKDGAKGAVVFGQEVETRIPPYPVDHVVDPVGAGDAFAAGVISGLLRSWTVSDAARLGAVLGARAITVSGDWEAAPQEDARQLLEQYTSALGLVKEHS